MLCELFPIDFGANQHSARYDRWVGMKTKELIDGFLNWSVASVGMIWNRTLHIDTGHPPVTKNPLISSFVFWVVHTHTNQWSYLAECHSRSLFLLLSRSEDLMEYVRGLPSGVIFYDMPVLEKLKYWIGVTWPFRPFLSVQLIEDINTAPSDFLFQPLTSFFL